MKAKLTIKNYRCFVRPTTIDLATGFTAFVGVNNAGKSAIMRFLLEMRKILRAMGQDLDALRTSVMQSFGAVEPEHVFDPLEVFSNRNKKDGIEFSIDFSIDGNNPPADFLKRAVFKYSRALMITTDLHHGGGTIVSQGRGGVQKSAPNHLQWN